MAKAKTTPTVSPVTTDTKPKKTPKNKKAPKVETIPEVTQDSDAPKEPKVRHVTAVSAEFVDIVLKSLSEETQDKLNKKTTKEVCEAFIKALVQQVQDGKTTTFTNNMTFKRGFRKARTHKNPKTGETVEKEAHYVFTMDVKPALKKAFEAITVEETTVVAEKVEA